MKIDHLIVMANQIGDFFRSYPDQDYAQKEIATHLRKFWAPDMRELIKDLVESKNQMIFIAMLQKQLENICRLFSQQNEIKFIFRSLPCP